MTRPEDPRSAADQRGLLELTGPAYLTGPERELAEMLVIGRSTAEVAAAQQRPEPAVLEEVAALRQRCGADCVPHLVALLIVTGALDRERLRAQLAVCARRDTEALPLRELRLWRRIARGTALADAARDLGVEEAWARTRVEELQQWWRATPEAIVAILALAGLIRIRDVRPRTPTPEVVPPASTGPAPAPLPAPAIAPGRAHAAGPYRRSPQRGAVAQIASALARSGQAVARAPRSELRPLAADVVSHAIRPRARVLVAVPAAADLIPALQEWQHLSGPGTTLVGVHSPRETGAVGHRPVGAALVAGPSSTYEHAGRLRPLVAVTTPDGLAVLAAAHTQHSHMPPWDLLVIEDPLAATSPGTVPRAVPVACQLALSTVTRLVAADGSSEAKTTRTRLGPIAHDRPAITHGSYRLKAPVVAPPAGEPRPASRLLDEILRAAVAAARRDQLRTLLVVTDTPGQARRLVQDLPEPVRPYPSARRPPVTGTTYDVRQTSARRAWALSCLSPHYAATGHGPTVSVVATSRPLRPEHPVDALLLLSAHGDAHRTATVLDHVLAPYRGGRAQPLLLIAPLPTDPCAPGTLLLDDSALHPLQAITSALAALDPQLRAAMNSARLTGRPARALAPGGALDWLTVTNAALPTPAARTLATALLQADTLRTTAHTTRLTPGGGRAPAEDRSTRPAAGRPALEREATGPNPQQPPTAARPRPGPARADLHPRRLPAPPADTTEPL